MARIVIDPVTRIEGHLRIEAQVEGGAVTDAWSSGTMFRGIEVILRGRDPREAWIWAQRICGVCTTVHALASVRAAGAQHHCRHAKCPGPHRPLLPPACARLGRCDASLEGRSGEDLAAGSI